MDYLIYLWGLFPEEYYKEVGIRHTSSELREKLCPDGYLKLKDGSKKLIPLTYNMNW